jgi:hypothetical protein
MQPLREEVESVVRTEGWSKAGMQKLVKLDSFLKESARFVPGGAGDCFSTQVFNYLIDSQLVQHQLGCYGR